MARILAFLGSRRPIIALIAAILVLCTIPLIDTLLVLRNSWQGIPPNFTDEDFYHARVQTIVKGHVTEGNPYFMEHADGPPLVIFAGTWINALPQLAGLPLNVSLILNFIVWSLLFAVTAYWLFKETGASSWLGVGGTLLLYVQSYAHVWRPANLQTVYPSYFLFYVGLARLIRAPDRKNILLLGAVTGSTFYLFAYLWQAAFITLGLLFLYALTRKDWLLAKATLLSTVLGGIIGLPVPAYALWLSHTSPYFWESVGRLGLVNTHVPMAEVFYSGGWIGLVLALIAILFFVRRGTLRTDREFQLMTAFVGISGLGLWIMQGSNLITGKLLETGEHVRLLIYPWFVVVIAALGTYVWHHRAELSRLALAASTGVVVALAVISINLTYQYFAPFLPSHINRTAWTDGQLAAKPYAWLEEHEKDSVVVWSNPNDPITTDLPIYTRHFTLYAWAGMMELVPEGEVRERYLVSQYFDNPTLADLKSDSIMSMYLGRHDMPHAAKSIEREVKVCRLVFFWNKQKDCGGIPTPQSLLGDQFFVSLEDRFQHDIKPNIKSYLAKYHVSYILKDTKLDVQYHPEKLGAKLVYSDGRFELYHL